jgi:RNA polymerase sigma factor (sigma-70 family)
MASNRTGAGVGEWIRAVHVRDAADLTDGQLLSAFRARGDEAAFAALVKRHGAMVLGVCRRLLGCEVDAEDAFQATFLVLVRRAAALSGRPVLGDWLHGVARRTALNARRLAARRREKEATMARPEATGEPARNDWLPFLDEELSRLPEKYRLPLVLCELEGWGRREAAERLGWPEGTVAGRLARGRALLARRLARRGLATPAGALAAALAQTVAPAALAASTARAAGLLAAGQAAAVSAKILTLTEGVLKAMFFGKLGTLTLAIPLFLVGAVALAHGMFAGGQEGGQAGEQGKIAPQLAVVERPLRIDGNLVIDAQGKAKQERRTVSGRELTRLMAFFPAMGQGRKSPVAGGWKAEYTVRFQEKRGRPLATVRTNSACSLWTEGQGDWKSNPGLKDFMDEFFKRQPPDPQGAEKAPTEQVDDRWSRPVNGLRARLVVVQKEPFNGTPVLVAYLELRNVSDRANPLEVPWEQAELTFTVTDATGRTVRAANGPYSEVRGPVGLLRLPFGSELRFNITHRGAGVPKDQGGILDLGVMSHWIFPPGDGHVYYLEGTLTVRNSDERLWSGTITLPRVRIALAKSGG